MLTVYSDKHKLRDANTELHGGELVRPFERPSRMTHITNRIKQVDLGEIQKPQEYGIEPILRIHDTAYLDFLKTAWEEWNMAGFKGEAIATSWPARRMAQKVPVHIEGRLGYYSMAAETAISPGTWEAAFACAQVALTAAHRICNGDSTVFALCRPPGHHAAKDMYGGYCFLNNAAIAAQSLLDRGHRRVAVLDVDFHHGNGSQDIFYDRNDVLFASLHGAPEHAFPHFLGYAGETGAGAGAGFNHNYPMNPGTGFGEWRKCLHHALARISDFSADSVVVSLGVDTFENDPISFFKLKSNDFFTYGKDLAQLHIPTLFVMEGGYDIKDIGVNVVNVLQGFESA